MQLLAFNQCGQCMGNDTKQPKPMTEVMCEVWEAAGKYSYQIGPDRDGLGMLEIRYYDKGDTTCTHRLSFTRSDAEAIIKAMRHAIDYNAEIIVG